MNGSPDIKEVSTPRSDLVLADNGLIQAGNNVMFIPKYSQPCCILCGCLSSLLSIIITIILFRTLPSEAIDWLPRAVYPDPVFRKEWVVMKTQDLHLFGVQHDYIFKEGDKVELIGPFTEQDNDFKIMLLNQYADYSIELTLSPRRNRNGYVHVNTRISEKYGTYLVTDTIKYTDMFKIGSTNSIVLTMLAQGFGLNINDSDLSNQRVYTWKKENEVTGTGSNTVQEGGAILPFRSQDNDKVRYIQVMDLKSQLNYVKINPK